MHGEFEITLTDVNTGVVTVDTVPAILTDFYKYESTYGFPFANRLSRQYGSTPTDGSAAFASFFTMSAFFNSSAVKLFTQALSEKKKDIRTKLYNNYCAFATNRAYNADEAALSSKYGYCSSYRHSIDRSTADGTLIEFNWHFDADKGNGVIKSVGTSAPIGVHAVDNEAIAPVDSTTTEQRGYDFSTYMAYNYMNDTLPRNSATALFSTYVADIDCAPLISARGTLNDKSAIREWYYQTKTKIVQLWSDSWNVLNESNNYITTIKYRIIDKKWLFQYCIGIGQSVHPLSMPDWLNNSGVSFDGSIEINSGAYELKNIALYSGTDAGKVAAEAKNAFAVFFVAQAGEYGVNPNPDGIDYSIGDNGKMCRVKTFAISGNTPTISTFDSVYDSPLSALITDRYASLGAYQQSLVPRSKILFDEQYNYYYVRTGGSLHSEQYYHYYAKRALLSDELLWRVDYMPNRELCLNFASTYELGIVAQYFTVDSNSQHCLGNGVIVDMLTGQTSEGYELDYNWVTIYASGKPFLTRVLLKPLRESPFMLCPCHHAEYTVAIATDFLYAKANLPNSITKTSGNTLDIKFTLYID